MPADSVTVVGTGAWRAGGVVAGGCWGFPASSPQYFRRNCTIAAVDAKLNTVPTDKTVPNRRSVSPEMPFKARGSCTSGGEKKSGTQTP